MLPRSLSSGVSLVALVWTSIASMGCSLFETKTTLADLDPMARVEVELDAEPMVHLLLPASDGACEAITDDVKANVNNREMDLFKRGGEEPSQGGWVCGAPTFRRALGPEDLSVNPTAFEVEDETASIHLEVDGLLAARMISVDTKSGKFPAGEEVRVIWSADRDVLDVAKMKVDVVYDDPMQVLPAPAAFRIDAGSVYVKIAPSSPLGMAVLRISATVGNPVVVCQGVSSCEAKVELNTEVALEVVPKGSTQ